MHATSTPRMFDASSPALPGNEPGPDKEPDQDNRPCSNVRVSVHGDRSTLEMIYRASPRNWEGDSSPDLGMEV